MSENFTPLIGPFTLLIKAMGYVNFSNTTIGAEKLSNIPIYQTLSEAKKSTI
jgi:hypothetical protein